MCNLLMRGNALNLMSVQVYVLRDLQHLYRVFSVLCFLRVYVCACVCVCVCVDVCVHVGVYRVLLLDLLLRVSKVDHPAYDPTVPIMPLASQGVAMRWLL